MVVTIKKGESKKSIQKKLEKLKSTKKTFPAHLFTGKMKIDKDPLAIQKRLRDEWG